jgi:predicted phage tail protein
MKVYLVGEVGEKFGAEWDMNAPRIRDVFNLIACQRPGFKQYIRDLAQKGVSFTIQQGSDFLEEKELEFNLSSSDTIITLVPAGAKGIGKIIVGAVILATVGWAVAAATGGTAAGGLVGFLTNGAGAATTLSMPGMIVMSLGINLVLGGIQEMLMPEPKTDRAEQDSYLFSGGVNSVREGQVVPVAYGELRVAGRPISVSYISGKPTTLGWDYVSAKNKSWVTNYMEAVGKIYA